MSVEVYAAMQPNRVELIVNGVVFTTACNTFNDALRIAQQTVEALGLGRTPDQGTLIIDGKSITIHTATAAVANTATVSEPITIIAYPDGKL